MTRVLLVDDDQSILRMLRLTFRTSGFDVRTASDGATALALVDEEPFDAIVLDLNMPVMDGETVLRTIRGRGDRTPVIVVSGRASPVHPRSFGADAFLPKPFRPDALIDVVDEFTRGRAVADNGAA